MFECTTKVLEVQNSDEASYSCSAVWEEEEDAEPSNEINVRVMGKCVADLIFFLSRSYNLMSNSFFGVNYHLTQVHIA